MYCWDCLGLPLLSDRGDISMLVWVLLYDSDKCCFYRQKLLASGDILPIFTGKIRLNILHDCGQSVFSLGAKFAFVGENIESLGIIMWQQSTAFSESDANGPQQLSSSHSAEKERLSNLLQWGCCLSLTSSELAISSVELNLHLYPNIRHQKTWEF